MRRSCFIILIVALTLDLVNPCKAVDLDASSWATEPWKSLAQTNLTQFLKEVTAPDGREAWQRTIMVPWTDAQSARQSFKVVEKVLNQLVNYRTNLPSLMADSEADFIKSLGRLHDFRDQLASENGYANALLADVLNRLIFVNLARRLIQDKSVSPGIRKEAARLTDFQLSPWKLVERLNGEVVGGMRLTISKSDDHVNQAFFELLQQSAGTTNHLIALSKAKAGSYEQLLEKRNIPALLMCYHRTDSLIHLSLPLLVQYIQKKPAFALDDDYQEIKKVLALDKETRKKLGSPLNPCHPGSEGEPERLIRAVASSQLDSAVGLSNGSERTVESRAGQEEVITRTLENIASAKEQIALLKSLHRESVITVQEIQEYLSSPLPIPGDGGKYEIGKVGEEPRFVKPDGSTIRMRRTDPHQ